jgi:adenylate cyclase
MIQGLIKRVVPLVAGIGADPNDDDDIRLQKSLLVICAFPFMFAGFAWGLMYILFNEPLAAAIPFSYGVVSLLSIIYFGRTRQYHFFRFSQLTLILLLPFLLMVALGGFINGSAVVLWALICPMGAMLFDEPRQAPRWFLAFLGLVVLSGFLQPYMRADNNLSPALVNFFFVINLIGVGSLVFLMVFYFVGQKNMFQQKSEALLLNILPKEIAAILKNESRTIADHYDEASVLFADMVGFTPLSAQLPPWKWSNFSMRFSHSSTHYWINTMWKRYEPLAIAIWWLPVYRAVAPIMRKRWCGWRWICVITLRRTRFVMISA